MSKNIDSPQFPKSYSEALYLIYNSEADSHVQEQDRFYAYLWLIKFFFQNMSFDKTQDLIQSAKTKLKLDAQQIEILNSYQMSVLEKSTARDNLTQRERELLQILEEGPCHPSILIQKLYGSSINYEVGINRIKNIIYLMRKKDSHLIVWEQGLIKRGDQ